jgi:hypothetical protein
MLYLDRLAALPVLKDFQRVYCSGRTGGRTGSAPEYCPKFVRRLVYPNTPNLSVLLAYIATLATSRMFDHSHPNFSG